MEIEKFIFRSRTFVRRRFRVVKKQRFIENISIIVPLFLIPNLILAVSRDRWRCSAVFYRRAITSKYIVGLSLCAVANAESCSHTSAEGRGGRTAPSSFIAIARVENWFARNSIRSSEFPASRDIPYGQNSQTTRPARPRVSLPPDITSGSAPCVSILTAKRPFKFPATSVERHSFNINRGPPFLSVPPCFFADTQSMITQIP
jgi:hypothetical protein